MLRHTTTFVTLQESNFNDAGVFLEKYIRKARHVEVQIFGNDTGEVATLGERDCSVREETKRLSRNSGTEFV